MAEENATMKAAIDLHAATFRTQHESVFFCPGRVNLIGEHLDYNGGLVFPAAIHLGIYAAVSFNHSDLIRVVSCDFPSDAISFSAKTAAEKPRELTQSWAAYVAATLLQVCKHTGASSVGLNIAFSANLPKGSGLSSSAAIEVLTGFILSTKNNWNISLPSLALLCQKAENEYVGVNCGIMDQFAVANGKENHTMMLNCENLHASFCPVSLGEYSFVVLNSNKPRQLVESKYNERRSECEQSLAMLNAYHAYPTLASAQAEHIEQHLTGNLLKRARHVLSEQQRVLRFKDALLSGDVALLGELMNASHRSLKHDYEVSGFELDTLCQAALSHPQCVGARMTGAGFGGCAVALVHQAYIADFAAQVMPMYQSTTGYVCDIFPIKLSQGVRMMHV